MIVFRLTFEMASYLLSARVLMNVLSGDNKCDPKVLAWKKSTAKAYPFDSGFAIRCV